MKEKRLIFRSALVAAALALGTTGSTAQTTSSDSDAVDLEVWYMSGFTAGAQQHQHPAFRLNNNGVAVEAFDVEVTLNGEPAFTECVTLDAPLASGAWTDITLQGTVTLPFAQTSTVGVKVVAEGDVNESNNTAETTVTMPRVLSYPYTWDPATAQQDFHFSYFWGLGWQWDANYEAICMSGKSTNWMGSITSDIFDFPEGEGVTCSFEYGTSGQDVTLFVTVDFGDEQLKDTVELGQSTEGFSKGFFSFEAKGPATIEIEAKLGGDWNAYGSIYLRDICLKQAVLDMAAVQILAPATSQVAISQEPISVSARFRNTSPYDAVYPVFCYQVGESDIWYEETYQGTVAGGQTLDFTFSQTYTATEAGTEKLRVWCKVTGDGDDTNDSLEKDITYYEALAFPYQTTFDEGNDLWAVADGSSWTFGQLSDGGAVGGQGGYLVSPAIQMPAGKSRVSFYYASAQASGAHLQLLMGKGTGAADLTEVLFSKDITNGGWLNGYHLIDLPEAGTYYFAFLLDDTSDQIIIDNFKVDAEEDLCINSVEFDQQSGFSLTEAKVTLSYVNHGITPQKGIEVRYYINDLEHFVTETVADEVAPGDTIFYTFQQPADISVTDQSYTVFGQIVTVVGADTQNDMIQGQTIQNFKPYGAPYYYDFTDNSQNTQWTLPKNGNNGWFIDSNWYAYAGGMDLQHTNYTYVSSEPADDWAYTPGILLEPGQYEVSFYHRGRTYFGGEEYAQSFEAKMGTERSPEGMTISLSRHENLDYAGCMNYKKDVCLVTISEAGEYYLGFHNFSPANDGETHIDGVSITAVESGLSLPFESNFAQGDEGWSKYNADGSDYFVKWQIQDGAEVATMDGGGYVEGPLTSPKLALEANKEVNITVDYELTADNADLALNVYGAALNTPQAMNLLATGSQEEGTVTASYTTGSEPEDFYVSLRTNSNIDERDYLYNSFTLRVKSVKVEYAILDGITTLEQPTQQDAHYYDLQGRRVEKPVGGLYIQHGRKYVVK